MARMKIRPVVWDQEWDQQSWKQEQGAEQWQSKV